MKTALKLDVTPDEFDLFDGMDGTYRREGLTVGSDYMRIHGVYFDMEVTHSDLIFGRRIGQGACSTVNIAKHTATGEKFAVKMFNVYDESQSRQLQIEICMLSAVQCDSLISLKGAFHSEGSIGIIIEYMDRGSLEFMLDEHLEVTESVMAGIVYQILWGLGYLHFDNRMHRDIKPGNILINSKGEVKLSDFGISRSLDSTNAMSSTSVGSFRYMSPERLIGDKYDSSGDIWSLGIMIIQLWTKRYPFNCISSPIDLLTELEEMTENPITKMLPKHMGEIVDLMLESDPERRGTSLELLESEWFQMFSIRDIRDAKEITEMWINSPSIRQGAEEKRSGISPKPVPSTFKMISPDSPVRNSICKNIRTSTFYESDCKESGVSNKENKQFESKKAFRRTPICEASRAKHISIGSTYSNCSNYSDDFEEYIDNDEDCINDHQNRK